MQAAVRRLVSIGIIAAVFALIVALLAIDGDLRKPDAEGERINDPSNRHNKWRYRLHLTIGELAAADRFNAWLRWMVEQSGR